MKTLIAVLDVRLNSVEEKSLDKIDLKIMNLLVRDSRIPYRNLASDVGITSNAIKERINKLISSGIVRNFAVIINPVIFGYEKECILILRHIDKTIKEQEILNRINLLGDIFVYAKQLGGVSIFILALRAGADDRIGIIVDLLRPVAIENIFIRYRPVTTNVHISDLKIMKYLLSNPRMQVEDIAKEASISSKTVARRLEKMRQKNILEFSISRDISSLQITGYIEFAVIINIDISYHEKIVERIYQEMHEHLVRVPNSYRQEVIFAALFCANIPTVNLIFKRLESYEGVTRVEVFITTNLVYYRGWFEREIDRALNQKYHQQQKQKIIT
jgi:DNA-binding Lrp family transcriptional regulator